MGNDLDAGCCKCGTTTGWIYDACDRSWCSYCMAKEFERLRAIVDKLNATEDGVPLTPGRHRYVVSLRPTPGREPYVEGEPCERPMHPYGWSTHALAIAAVRAEERRRGWLEELLTPEEAPEAAEAAGGET